MICKVSLAVCVVKWWKRCGFVKFKEVLLWQIFVSTLNLMIVTFRLVPLSISTCTTECSLLKTGLILVCSVVVDSYFVAKVLGVTLHSLIHNCINMPFLVAQLYRSCVRSRWSGIDSCGSHYWNNHVWNGLGSCKKFCQYQLEMSVSAYGSHFFPKMNLWTCLTNKCGCLLCLYLWS